MKRRRGGKWKEKEGREVKEGGEEGEKREGKEVKRGRGGEVLRRRRGRWKEENVANSLSNSSPKIEMAWRRAITNFRLCMELGKFLASLILESSCIWLTWGMRRSAVRRVISSGIVS